MLQKGAPLAKDVVVSTLALHALHMSFVLLVDQTHVRRQHHLMVTLDAIYGVLVVSSLRVFDALDMKVVDALR